MHLSRREGSSVGERIKRSATWDPCPYFRWGGGTGWCAPSMNKRVDGCPQLRQNAREKGHLGERKPYKIDEDRYTLLRGEGSLWTLEGCDGGGKLRCRALLHNNGPIPNKEKDGILGRDCDVGRQTQSRARRGGKNIRLLVGGR